MILFMKMISLSLQKNTSPTQDSLTSKATVCLPMPKAMADSILIGSI